MRASDSILSLLSSIPTKDMLLIRITIAAIALIQLARAEEQPVSFSRDIKPILREKCVHCHNQKTLPGRVSFESAKKAFAKNQSGQSVIVPGDPDKSIIVIALESSRSHERSMPQTGQKPTTDQIQLIRQWIQQGADWPRGFRGWIKPTFRPGE